MLVDEGEIWRGGKFYSGVESRDWVVLETNGWIGEVRGGF